MANGKQPTRAEKNTIRQTKANAAKKKAAQEGREALLSVKALVCIVSLVLFVLFTATCLNPDGALLKLISGLMQGLVGKAAFYILIPSLLYLFFLCAFEDRKVLLRGICLFVFVLCCGCISHLYLSEGTMPKGFAAVKYLYSGGPAGSTGGVICGGITLLLRWLCGTAVSYIILGVAAFFTLLASFGFTIPSIIRAIKNRPRADWEEERRKRREEAPEPAQVVVNHIANKRIEYVENRRVQQEQAGGTNPSPAIHGPRKQKMKDLIRQTDLPEKPEEPACPEFPVSSRVPSEKNRKPEDASPIVAPIVVPETEEPKNPVVEKILPVCPEEPIPERMPDLDPEEQPAALQKVTSDDAAESAAEVAREIAQADAAEKAEYCFPPIDLLKLPGGAASDGTEEMRENSRRLNETLASFKIEAHIINVTRGPSVTRYEVELEKGVRLNKLTSCADDIALSLGASGVRIAAVPGKISIVGIEVPNRSVTTVSLREVIDSREFSSAKSKSSFAVGKDIGGSCIIGNISKLPHMLIAGTTGSGKSVCMNSIIISLLYKASPSDVKLIMVDPKMVELGIYNGIPHLLIPVVTDPKKAAGSLQWAVTEMLRRYKAMSDAGVRELDSYNSMIDSQEMEGERLPKIVVIIDELADLMLVAAKEVEESICRIAQMGRAAGIHLIIATQRPSADVITGLMKANIPSRIAFSVASAMESRIILDTQGAEKLVGKGDMLFSPIGALKPTRVQGCFVSDSEVEAVASYVKQNFKTEYDSEVMEDIERKSAQTGNAKDKNAAGSAAEPTADEFAGDEMLPEAVDVILETGQASVSMLQRRLKLGYARAARIVDEMEEMGIVGPFMGSKPRTILVTKEQWQQMRSGGVQAEQLAVEEPEDFVDLEDAYVPEPLE